MQLTLPIDLDGPEGKVTVNQMAEENEGSFVGESLVGSWCGGERFVVRNDRLVPANVWFHFLDGGRISVSVRCRRERQPSMAMGTWRVEGKVLSIAVGNREVQAEVSLNDGVVRWAGEVLVRMPEGLDHPFPALGQDPSVL